jgi:hypothetical protein
MVCWSIFESVVCPLSSVIGKTKQGNGKQRQHGNDLKLELETMKMHAQ